jgi:hypothetical protein
MKAAVLALVAALLAATTGSASTVVIQASDYIASYNAGGADFYTTPCGGATNGLGVEGYDYPGDWIELKMVIGKAGAYRDSLRTAADDESEGDHLVTVFAAGGVPVGAPSPHHTVGLGIG